VRVIPFLSKISANVLYEFGVDGLPVANHGDRQGGKQRKCGHTVLKWLKGPKRMKFKCEKTYNVDETAKVLKLAPKTVLRYLREGVIVGAKMHGKWLVSESALSEFFATPKSEFVNRVLPLLSAYKPKA